MMIAYKLHRTRFQGRVQQPKRRVSLASSCGSARDEYEENPSVVMLSTPTTTTQGLDEERIQPHRRPLTTFNVNGQDIENSNAKEFAAIISPSELKFFDNEDQTQTNLSTVSPLDSCLGVSRSSDSFIDTTYKTPSRRGIFLDAYDQDEKSDEEDKFKFIFPPKKCSLPTDLVPCEEDTKSIESSTTSSKPTSYSPYDEIESTAFNPCGLVHEEEHEAVYALVQMMRSDDKENLLSLKKSSSSGSKRKSTKMKTTSSKKRRTVSPSMCMMTGGLVKHEGSEAVVVDDQVPIQKSTFSINHTMAVRDETSSYGDGGVVGMRLATPEDSDALNSLHCFVRAECLEICTVVVQKSKKASSTESDEGSASTCSSPFARVGFRCISCGQQEQPGATMSAFFPKSLEDIYRGVCTWQRLHFKSCSHIPDDMKIKYQNLKELDRTRGRKAHWIKSAYQIGLRNVDDQRNGIVWTPNTDIGEIAYI